MTICQTESREQEQIIRIVHGLKYFLEYLKVLYLVHWYLTYNEFLQPLVNSVRCETESISYLGPKVWGMVPDTYKNIESPYNFKNTIKKWKAENCPCRICKIFIKNIGFCETAWIIIFLKPVVFYILIFLLHILKFKFQKVLL